jgi:hypothetical protein
LCEVVGVNQLFGDFVKVVPRAFDGGPLGSPPPKESSILSFADDFLEIVKNEK